MPDSLPDGKKREGMLTSVEKRLPTLFILVT